MSNFYADKYGPKDADVTITPEGERLVSTGNFYADKYGVADDNGTKQPVPEQAPVEEEGPGFLERTGDRLAEGVRGARDRAALPDELSLGGKLQENLGQVSNAVRTGGDIAGDAIMSGVKAVTPDWLQEGVGSAADAIMNTDVVKNTVDAGKYIAKDLREENPRGAQLFDDLSGVAPLMKNPLGGMTRPNAPKPNYKAVVKKQQNAINAAESNTRRGKLEKFVVPDPADRTGKMKESTGFWEIQSYDLPARTMAALDEVEKIKKVNPEKSVVHNSNAMDEAVDVARKKLDSRLIAYTEKGGKGISEASLNASIGNKVNSAGMKSVLVGDIGASAAGLFEHFQGIVKSKLSPDGTISPKDLLDARRQLDDEITSLGKKDPFNSTVNNGQNQGLSVIRESINDLVDGAVKNTDVKASLQMQHKILTVRDSLRYRYYREKSNRFTRYIQNMETTYGIKHPTTPVALKVAGGVALSGIAGFLGAPSLIAASSLLAAGWGIKKALDPKSRLAYTKAMGALDTLVRKGGKIGEQAKLDRAFFADLLSESDQERKDKEANK